MDTPPFTNRDTNADGDGENDNSKRKRTSSDLHSSSSSSSSLLSFTQRTDTIHASVMSRELHSAHSSLPISENDFNNPNVLLLLLQRLPDLKFNDLEELLERICGYKRRSEQELRLMVAEVLYGKLVGAIGRQLDSEMQRRSSFPSQPLAEEASFETIAKQGHYDTNPVAARRSRWASSNW